MWQKGRGEDELLHRAPTRRRHKPQGFLQRCWNETLYRRKLQFLGKPIHTHTQTHKGEKISSHLHATLIRIQLEFRATPYLYKKKKKKVPSSIFFKWGSKCEQKQPKIILGWLGCERGSTRQQDPKSWRQEEQGFNNPWSLDEWRTRVIDTSSEVVTLL